MPLFEVILNRGYIVHIKAETEEKARDYTEFFIGGEHDLSTPVDRIEHQFEFVEFEKTVNDAIEVNPLSDKE